MFQPFRLLLSVAVGLLVVGAAASRSHSVPAEPAIHSRLSPDVVPSRYNLRIETDLEASQFKGTETILVSVRRPVSTIVLNAAELQISKVGLRPAGSSSHTTRNIRAEVKPQLEQVHLLLPQLLPAGQYEISLAFEGALNDRLRGFYRAHYNDARGVRRTLAATQMEPTDARRMFPCFDEPAFKATYQITALVAPDLTAISNAPIKSESTDPTTGQKLIEFAPTPPMSTYLVALVVGKFQSTEPRVVDGVPIKVWTVPGKAGMGRYAQEMAGRLLTYYNNYFGIPYPAQKLDLVAIPDFEAGAMENLGCITFRETLLLVDDKTASTATRQQVAAVTAHEMAHMWFGDLVTMAWWDDLWLNEAFATWMATKSVDFLMPEWHLWDRFSAARSSAMATDSLLATRPIRFRVNNPEQANEMFDEITYVKGSSVLRMLEQWVGEAAFRAGLQRYMKKYQFKNARTEDLWEAIGAASGQDVSGVMEGWVNQPGLPLISLEAPSADGRRVKLTQQRFLLAPHSKTTPLVWQVPVGVKPIIPAPSAADKRSSRPSRGVDLVRSAAHTIVLPKPAKLFFANAGGDGYYRTRHPAQFVRQLGPLIQSRLSPAERLCLLSDQWALTLAGHTPVSEYLELTASYRADSDPSVVDTLVGQLNYLHAVVDDRERPEMEALIRDRLAPALSRLGWSAQPGEPDLTKILRGRVVETLGTTGQDEQVIARARGLFARYLKEPNSVDPNMLDAITESVAYNGDSSDYDIIRQCWLEAGTPEVEERNLLALGAFRKPSLIRKSLALTLSHEVRAQDAPHLLSTILGNHDGRRLAWQFIKDHWREIVDRFPMNMVPRVVSAAGSLNAAEDEADLRTFFRTHPVTAGQRAVARTIERVSINVRFKQRSLQDVSNWLSKEFRDQQTTAASGSRAGKPD
ncbi:MAG TPA: M1 family metallopeptidase [Candidatus Obscuribacterales bacterium]